MFTLHPFPNSIYKYLTISTKGYSFYLVGNKEYVIGK